MNDIIIKLISDTHNDHQELDQDSLECDILIHCGDFGTRGNYSETISFLHWFVKQPAKYKLLVPGNHDKKIKTHAELQKLCYEFGIHLLMNQEVTIKGYKFYGGHFVPWFRQGVCQTKIEDRITAWQNIPEDTSVLITHVPPKGIFDTNIKGEHCGCDQLLKKVQEVKPIYHVFGHIHEHAHKQKIIKNVTYINACNKDRNYITVNSLPIKITLPEIYEI